MKSTTALSWGILAATVISLTAGSLRVEAGTSDTVTITRTGVPGLFNPETITLTIGEGSTEGAESVARTIPSDPNRLADFNHPDPSRPGFDIHGNPYTIRVNLLESMVCTPSGCTEEDTPTTISDVMFLALTQAPNPGGLGLGLTTLTFTAYSDPIPSNLPAAALTLAQNEAVGMPNNLTMQLFRGYFRTVPADIPPYDVQFQSCSCVPEPSSLVILGSGILGLLGYAWGRRRGVRSEWHEDGSRVVSRND